MSQIRVVWNGPHKYLDLNPTENLWMILITVEQTRKKSGSHL